VLISNIFFLKHDNYSNLDVIDLFSRLKASQGILPKEKKKKYNN
jgi:hypothetical protein